MMEDEAVVVFAKLCQICKKALSQKNRRQVGNHLFEQLIQEHGTSEPHWMKRSFMNLQSALKLFAELEEQTAESALRACLELSSSSCRNNIEGGEVSASLKETVREEVWLGDLIKEISNFACCLDCYPGLKKFKEAMMERVSDEAVEVLESLKNLKLTIMKDLMMMEDEYNGTEANTDEPLPYLPQEIWEIIIDQLETLDDMRSAANSFKTWRKMLKPKQTLWLFPTNILPFLSPFLKKSEILRCRRVCSHWRQGVDEFLESAQHLAPFTSHYYIKNLHTRRLSRFWKLHTNPSFLTIPYVLDKSQMRQRFWFGGTGIVNVELLDRRMRSQGFLDAMIPSENESGILPRNNQSFIIGRSLYAKRVDLTTLPREAGLQISHLELDYFDRSNLSGLEILGDVCVALKTMPNLRQLKISAQSASTCATYKALMKYGQMQLPGLSFSTTPQKLRTLQFDLEAKSCLEMIDLLLKELCSGLGRLELNTWSMAHRWSYLDWGNLTELHIISKDPCLYISGKLLSGLLPIAKTATKLGKLCLSYFVSPPEPDMEFPRMLRYLMEQFKMIRWLKLKFADRGPSHLLALDEDNEFGHRIWLYREFWSNFTNIPRPEPASFPLVHTLEINYLPIKECYLLHFPNLEELIVCSDQIELNLVNMATARLRGNYREMKNMVKKDPILMDRWVEGEDNISTQTTVGAAERFGEAYDFERYSMLSGILPRAHEDADGDVYDSLIWTILPKFKRFVLNGKEYTRAGYCDSKIMKAAGDDDDQMEEDDQRATRDDINIVGEFVLDRQAQNNLIWLDW